MTLRLLIGFILVVAALVLNSCVPAVVNEVVEELSLDFDKGAIQQDWDAIDRRNIDSISTYLSSPDPNKRALALRGLSTIPDTTQLDSIAALLQDPIEEIREIAAYTLGQSGTNRAVPFLIAAFNPIDTLAGRRLFNRFLLEAVGKTGKINDLQNIATVKTYQAQDVMLIEGQAIALFRFALRGITNSAAVEKAVELIESPDHTETARLYAAHTLARSPNIYLDAFDERLHKIATTSDNADIRIALASAFRHIQSDFGFQSLKDWVLKEKDPNVQAVIFRSILSFEDRDILELINQLIKNDNINIAALAASQFKNHTPVQEVASLRRRAKAMSSRPWQVRSEVYLAANRLLSNNYRISKENMNNEIELLYKNSKDIYAKAAYLKAWAQYAPNLDQVIAEYSNTNSPVLKSAILDVLLNLAGPDQLKKSYAGMQRSAKSKIAELLKESILSNDPSSIAIVSSTVSKQYNHWRPYFRNVDFLASALDSLDLPKDYEAYYEGQQLIQKTKGIDAPIAKPAYNHPIDWTVVSDLPDTVKVHIDMDIGTIKLDLYKQNTPGTVANFVQLSQAEYYNGKSFHRVVPAFVAQAGCPIGNGFGSLDYTIRSEFMPIYYDRPGRIGMASLGADTEGTQWFITHTATPHLDGRYTIFGQVTDGLSILNKIAVGDRIKEVKILNI